MVLFPNCQCCQDGCCLPDYAEVEIGTESLLGVLGMTGSPYIWYPGTNVFDTNLSHSTSIRFPLPVSYSNTNTEAGPIFSCTSPSNAAGKCMRLSPARLQEFSSAVAGTYRLDKTASCDRFVYVNAGACNGNFIRSLTVYVQETAANDYGAELPGEFIETASDGTLRCQEKFSTYPSNGPPGIEYRMVAEICIAGDLGNQNAAGCSQDTSSNGGTNLSRCNCYPTTATTQATYNSTTGAVVRPAQSGPCSYSGTCYASLVMSSVGSLKRTWTSGSIPNSFLSPLGSRAINNVRATWSSGATGSIANIMSPQFAIINGFLVALNPYFDKRWCDINGPYIYGCDFSTDYLEYLDARCGKFTSDIYFALSTRSPLMNYMEQQNLPPYKYNIALWDYFGLGVKLKKTLIP